MSEEKSGIQTLPAARGIAWLASALALFRDQALRLLLLGLMLQVLAGLTQFGALGVLFVLCVPALSAGMLQAMHAAAAGMRPAPGLLFVAFRRPECLLRLLSLGGLMLAAALAAVMLVLSGALAGVGPEVMARLEQGDVEALLASDPALLERLLLALAAGLLISGTISYFSVPLIWFRNAPLGRSIAAGLSGMVRNWKPLLVLALFLGVLAVPVALLSGLVVGLNAAGAGGSPVMTLVVLLAAVLYQVLLFATQYVAFGEIFGLPGPGARDQEETGQLAA